MTQEFFPRYMDLVQRQHFNCKQLFLADERDFICQVLEEKVTSNTKLNLFCATYSARINLFVIYGSKKNAL